MKKINTENLNDILQKFQTKEKTKVEKYNHFLIDEFNKITGDTHSDKHIEKAIKILGEGPVSEIIGEIKYKIKKGEITKNPAGYISKSLKKLISEKNEVLNPLINKEIKIKEKLKKITTYISPTQQELWQELEPVTKQEMQEEIVATLAMMTPYSDKTSIWASIVLPQLITLKSNKKLSDKVVVKYNTLDGNTFNVPIHRGKMFKGDDERGILTVEHGRILTAVIDIWIEQGCKYYSYTSGAQKCFCYVEIRNLAKILDWKDFNQQYLIWLKKKLTDLSQRPIYFELEAIQGANLKGYGFTLLHIAKVVERKEKTIFYVEFSDPISRQLLKRRTVTRNKELVRMRNGLAFLTRLYIEPSVIGNGKYNKNLGDLVKELQLPNADWHDKKYDRMIQFKKALKELKCFHTSDNKIVNVSIKKGKEDWMIVAELVKAEIINDKT